MNHEEWIKINTRFVRGHAKNFIEGDWPNVEWFVTCGPHYGASPRYRWAKRKIHKHLQDGMTVLDIGGGIGAFGTYFTAVMGHRFNYVNLEMRDFVNLTPEYFAAFGLPWNGHQVVQLDALKERLPFDAETFDMIWMFGWYDSRRGFDKLFPEMFHILKPGGVLFFNVLDERAKPPNSKITISRPQLEKTLIENGYDILFLGLVPGDNDYRVMCGKPK